MATAYVGIGANRDDPATRVRAALAALEALPETQVVKRSSLYRTEPQGYRQQPDFVNAVAELDTRLPAGRLLTALHAIEAAAGRERSFANAPRTLDLDLLLYGSERVDQAGLVVPHPRMHERAFVLVPLVEIAPDAVIPGVGTARACLERVRTQFVERIS